VSEGETEMTMTCAMSSATEMPMTELKTGAKNKTASNRNNAMKGTMIIQSLLQPTSLTTLPEGGHNKGGVKVFPIT
jgi:hypothetical protein